MKAKNLMVLAIVGLAFGGGLTLLLLRSNAQPETKTRSVPATTRETGSAAERESGRSPEATPGVEILSPTNIKRGAVTAIEGRLVTIRPRGGDAASYEVSPTARVDEILDPTALEPGQPSTREITLEAIEIGDNVELWFSPDDSQSMVAQAVVVAKF